MEADGNDYETARDRVRISSHAHLFHSSRPIRPLRVTASGACC